MQKLFGILTLCVFFVATYTSCTYDPQLGSVGQAMKTNKAYFEDNGPLLNQIRGLANFTDHSFLAVALAEEASKIVDNPRLAKLANQIMKDHKGVQKSLMGIADSINFALPTTMTRESYDKLADLNLEAKKNPNFDLYYLTSMMENYEAMSQDLKSLGVADGNDMIYAFAKDTKAALKKHANYAVSLNKTMAHDHDGHDHDGHDHDGHDHDGHDDAKH